MFENETFENILDRMLESMPSDIDKREGSIAYDALAPVAIELANSYISVDGVLQEAFADTATKDYLIMRAKEQGIYIEGATKAIYKGEFDAVVPVGSRFNSGSLNFEVIEPITGFEYLLSCETAGTIGNNSIGNLVAIDYIEGLGVARLVELITPGRDEEDTEEFRERYFNEVDGDAFGGNRADYIETVKRITGGQVKVYRTPNNVGGNVKVLITDSDNNIPTDEYISSIKEQLDPTEYEGLGCGIVPIGHCVNVSAPGTVTANIVATVRVEEGLVIADSVLKEVLENYINETNSKWEESEGLTLYTAHIISRLLEISGVINVSDVTINNLEQITANSESMFKLGTYTIEQEN